MRVTVFCGSSRKINEAYIGPVAELVSGLAVKHVSLNYGGANTGLMGVLAKNALEKGVHTTGVIAEEFVESGLLFNGLSKTVVFKTIARRKNFLVENADAFLILPGGSGTMDEFFHLMLARQLRNNTMPIGLLNLQGYFDPLFKFLVKMHKEGFVQKNFISELFISENPAELIIKMGI